MRPKISGLAFWAALLISCVIAPGGEDDSKKLGEKAIQSMRVLKGYRVQYRTELNDGKGKPFSITGTATVVNPDVFFTHYTTDSGRVDKRVIVKGDQALIEHPNLKEIVDEPSQAWVTPAQAGDNDAGIRGHNPDKVMSVLKNYLDRGTLGKAHKIGDKECQELTIEFRGDKIKEVIAEQGIKLDEINWEESSLSCRLSVGQGDSLIHEARLKASLLSTNKDIRGRIEYEASFNLRDVNQGLDFSGVPADVLKKVGISSSPR